MKKERKSGGSAEKAPKVEKPEEPQGGSMNRFQSYLQSDEGMNSMKMFVVVNSLVMILTMGWPAMKMAYEMVAEKLEEWELM